MEIRICIDWILEKGYYIVIVYPLCSLRVLFFPFFTLTVNLPIRRNRLTEIEIMINMYFMK